MKCTLNKIGFIGIMLMAHVGVQIRTMRFKEAIKQQREKLKKQLRTGTRNGVLQNPAPSCVEPPS